MIWQGCRNYPMFRWWGWRYRNRWWGKWVFQSSEQGTAIELGPLQITVGFMDWKEP